MTRRRVAVIGLVLVGVALVASVAVSGLGSMVGIDAKPGVPTFEVGREDFVRRVRAEGNLESATATPITPPPTRHGPLRIAWLTPDGTRVEAGEVVIRFDSSEMEENLAEGRSEQAKSDSRILSKNIRKDSAARNLQRDADIAGLELNYAENFGSKDPTIFSRNDIIESEIDQALAIERRDHAESVQGVRAELADVELELLGIERRKAELQIEQAEEGLQKLEVQAPHDGIFVLKEVWGRVPEVGAMVWAGNQLAELPQLDVMQAKVFVLEADAGGLEAGQTATVILDAHPDTRYAATIKKVDTLATRRFRQVPVQYFGVTLELEATDPAVMKPGQRVQATIILGEREQALVVPRQAVFEVDGANVVYVGSGSGFEAVEVELGPAALGRIVVEKGVEVGDRVALSDPTRPLSGGGDSDGNSGGPRTPGSGS